MWWGGAWKVTGTYVENINLEKKILMKAMRTICLIYRDLRVPLAVLASQFENLSFRIKLASAQSTLHLNCWTHSSDCSVGQKWLCLIDTLWYILYPMKWNCSKRVFCAVARKCLLKSNKVIEVENSSRRPGCRHDGKRAAAHSHLVLLHDNKAVIQQ